MAAAAHAPGVAAYCASKAGVEAFANSLRPEVAHLGVDVGVAYFSWIATDLVAAGDEHPAFAFFRSKLRGPAGRTYPLSDAADAMVAGIEDRARRVVAPGWVRAVLFSRGFLGRAARARQPAPGSPSWSGSPRRRSSGTGPVRPRCPPASYIRDASRRRRRGYGRSVPKRNERYGCLSGPDVAELVGGVHAGLRGSEQEDEDTQARARVARREQRSAPPQLAVAEAGAEHEAVARRVGVQAHAPLDAERRPREAPAHLALQRVGLDGQRTEASPRCGGRLNGSMVMLLEQLCAAALLEAQQLARARRRLAQRLVQLRLNTMGERCT